MLTSERPIRAHLVILLVAMIIVAGCSEGDQINSDRSTATQVSELDAENSNSGSLAETATVGVSDPIPATSIDSEIDPETGTSTSYVVILLASALIVSGTLNLFVVRWLWWGRKFRASPASVDELLLGSVENHHKDLQAKFHGLVHLIETTTKVQQEIAESSSEKAENLTSSFQVLRSALDERDEEIKRLKEGYDLAIFRRFVTRFVRLDLALVEELSEMDDGGQLNDFRELLLDALDECGVTPFVPEVGADFRTVEGVEDDPIIEATDDFRQDGKISRVVRSGYLLENSETSEVVIPARVAIFKQQKSEV